MVSWLTQVKSLFTRPEKVDNSRLERFLPILTSNDYNDIEEARGWVQEPDIEPLMGLYWRLDAWEQKGYVVDLLQDQYHDDLPKLMLDFLRAPLKPGDEGIELSQAAALGFIDEKYDRFMTYYNDRQLLARDIGEVLRKNGLRPDAPPPKQPITKPQPPKSNANWPPNARLISSAEKGDLAGVQKALVDGAHKEAFYREGLYEGCTSLLRAVMNKHNGVAVYLIEQGVNVNCKRPSSHRPDPSKGQSPLWWAANYGDLSLIQTLLAHGAEVNAPDHHGGTPLSQAASAGHLDAVRYLVEQGAAVHSRISDGRTPFNLAVTNGHRRVVEYLLTVGNGANEAGASGYSPLMVAASNNFYDLAKVLIRAGADVNGVHPGRGIYTNLKGWTPLVFAVNSSYVRLTKLLLQSGADIHYRVPATAQNPERGILDFVKGKRAESLINVLKNAGAK